MPRRSALSLLVLHFVSDAQQAAHEMRRVVRPGGVVAASVWDTYGGMPSQRIFWDTVTAIEAIDFEPDFVTSLQAKIGTKPITARQGDACSLPFADAAFDRALSLLVLHFVSDAQQAAHEMRRVVRPGGVVAVAVWDTYGGMPSQRLFWDTITAIEPSLGARRAATMFRPATQAGDLPALLGRAGLTDIRESLLTIRMEFADFEDYWQPLMTGQGNLAELVDGLAAPTRVRVIEAVRAAFLSGRPDGPRNFASVAWAARGVVPG